MEIKETVSNYFASIILVLSDRLRASIHPSIHHAIDCDMIRSVQPITTWAILIVLSRVHELASLSFISLFCVSNFVLKVSRIFLAFN